MTPKSEAAIWARLIDALTPDAARYLLAFRFTDVDQSRMQDLAEKSEAGTLTDHEAREFDSYLHVGNLLAVMHSKASMILYGSELQSRIDQ
jgi:hypothetical protein